MARIIRTKSMARGGITDDERAQMREHVRLWTARAFRTGSTDKHKLTEAIEGIYAAAHLKKPRIVIVPSPLVMAFAYGASAAIWYKRKNSTGAATAAAAVYDADTYDAARDATDAATTDAMYVVTYVATLDATSAATDTATYDAMHAATLIATDADTYDATDASTRAATRAATRDATYADTLTAVMDATDAATHVATYAATYAATDAATDAATRVAVLDAAYDATYAVRGAMCHDAAHGAIIACSELAGSFGIKCARRWLNVYHGGNMWSAYDSHLTAYRDIIGLDLTEHAAYRFWELAAINGGFRVMHEEFCMVSEFPERLLVDDQNRPHCEDGPSHRWRDGWALYHWHGTLVPAHWIECRKTLDPLEVIRASNVEQRAAGAAIIGWPLMASVLNRRIIDGDPDTDIGALIELTLPGLPEPGRFLQAVCPRNGAICEGVPRTSDIDGLPIETVIAAQAWRDGLPAAEYQHPIYRT